MSEWRPLKQKPKPSFKVSQFHDYQKEGVKFLLAKSYAALFWDPGLGKTSTVLRAYHLLRQMKMVKKLLVVSKLNIIRGTWPNEIEKWGFPFSTALVHGSERKRLEALDSGADVSLINFEGIPWLMKNLKHPALEDCMLVIDESSKFRHTNTKRFKALKPHLGWFSRRMILTGTPVPNGLVNLFSQMYIVDQGESLGAYITKFRNEYFYPAGYMGYEWKIQKGAEKRIYSRIKKRVLRFDRSLLNLPPLHKVARYITLSEEAYRVYRELEKEFISVWRGGTITAANAAVASGKLRQLTGGAVYMRDEDSDERRTEVVHDEKLEELESVIDELGEKPVIILYEFDHERVRIDEFLRANFGGLLPRKAGKTYVPSMYGGTDKTDALYEKMWADEKISIILCQTSKVAHGLNLQRKHANLIFYTPTFNLEDDEQVIQRIWRQGQETPVTVFYLVVTDSVDEVALEAVDAKGKVQTRLLDALRRRYGKEGSKANQGREKSGKESHSRKRKA